MSYLPTGQEIDRSWQDGFYRLDIGYAGSERGGRVKVAYALYFDNQLIFSGEDYSPSPLHTYDGDASTVGLLGFLATRPGDTDEEYFKNYTELQFNFLDECGDEFAYMVYELELLLEVVCNKDLGEYSPSEVQAILNVYRGSLDEDTVESLDTLLGGEEGKEND